MKKCIACRRSKPASAFYAHSAMADGTLNKCKECCILYAKARRLGPARESILEYDRRRSLEPHRYLKPRTQRPAESAQRWSRENREKRRAHLRVKRAIEAGRLIRAACERCQNPRTQAHHDDYSKPLDVMWLCSRCHGLRHREINEERRTAQRAREAS